MHDDGVFNDCLINDHEFDDEIASINSNMSAMENNLSSNDVFDGQLYLMDDDDNDDNG